jgi:lactose/L-arabinose transport system substrate-binding protein
MILKSSKLALTSLTVLSTTFVATLGMVGISSAKQDTKQPVTLTVMSWNVAEATLQKDATLYHQLHPNVNFKFVTIDSPTDTYTKLNAELAAGVGVPDVVSIESSQSESFISKFPNSFLNLTSRVTSIKKDFTGYKWGALTGPNNQVYGIPWDTGSSLLFYRKDMFKAAGINPNSIHTWSQYIAAGKKLTAFYKGKVKMTAAAMNDEAMFKMLMNEQGAFFFNQKGQITLNNPAGVRTVNVLKQMYNSGIIKQVPVATDWNDIISAFVNNQIATVPFGIWYVGTLETSAKNQSGKWAVMPLPAFTANGSHSANLGGSNLMISAKTPHPNTAYDFSKFAMSNTKALNVSMSYGIFPSYIPYFKSPAITESLKFFGGQKVFQMAANLAKNITPENHTGDYTTALPFIKTALYNALTNQQSVTDALNTAAQKIAQVTGRTIVK